MSSKRNSSNKHTHGSNKSRSPTSSSQHTKDQSMKADNYPPRSHTQSRKNSSSSMDAFASSTRNNSFTFDPQPVQMTSSGQIRSVITPGFQHITPTAGPTVSTYGVSSFNTTVSTATAAAALASEHQDQYLLYTSAWIPSSQIPYPQTSTQQTITCPYHQVWTDLENKTRARSKDCLSPLKRWLGEDANAGSSAMTNYTGGQLRIECTCIGGIGAVDEEGEEELNATRYSFTARY